MKKNILSIGMLTACCTVTMSSVAFALVPTIGGYMSRGVDNMCYYVDSSASAYTSYINTGISRWTNGGHSPSDFINMTAVSSNYATAVDYYAQNQEDFFAGYAYAQTNFFSESGMGGSGVSPYYYTEILINKGTFPDCTNFEKIGIMAHEFGHALGLAENNTVPTSIMCQLGEGRTVNTVSTEDYDTVVSIYE